MDRLSSHDIVLIGVHFFSLTHSSDNLVLKCVYVFRNIGFKCIETGCFSFNFVE